MVLKHNTQCTPGINDYLNEAVEQTVSLKIVTHIFELRVADIQN